MEQYKLAIWFDFTILEAYSIMRGLIYKSLVVLIALLAINANLSAQSGSYFIANYNPGEQNFDNTNYAVVQDERGVMHFANKQGVLHFDGNSWWLSPTPYSIFCLAETNDKIYVGGRQGFGMITKSGLGEAAYSAIDSLHRDINNCLVTDSRVYYSDDHRLYSFYLSNPAIIDTVYTAEEEILDLLSIKGKIYLTLNGIGLQELRGKELQEPFINEPAGTYFIRQSPAEKLLFFTEKKEIYTDVYDSIAKINFDNRDNIIDLDVTEIIWVSDSLIAVSTLSEGIFVVNAYSGVTDQIVDYDTGLPDNQISTIAIGKAGEIWAVHGLGLSVISPNLPLRTFSHYTGLSGTLLIALTYQEQLIIGTSTGVFRLVKRRNIRESVEYDRVRVRITGDEEVVEKKRNRGLFKRKKKKEAVQASQPKYKYVYRKRIVEEELSVHHEFEKIKGINAKTVNLLSYNNQLLAGTVHGVYKIDGDTSQLIAEVPVLNMYGLPNKNLLFVSTIDEEVRTLSYQNAEWRNLNMLEGLNDYIVQIALDPDENIWLCGADSLYRLEIEGYHLNDVEVYSFENPHFNRIYAVNYNGEILFINNSGYYSYTDREIIRNNEIENTIGLAQRCVLGSDGELLVNTGSNWYGADKDIRNTLNFLSLFKDPQYVARAEGQNFWVISGSNELYKINADEISSITSNEAIYLKEVRDNDGRISFDLDLEVNQDNSSLTFEFASPDYSGIYQKQYQFRLTNTVGTQSPWSPWSITNNVVSYQFLPQGTYILEARFKNALGKVINAAPFKFGVVPPYWKRPWFYILELVFFGSLLFLSFYLNRGKGKYLIVSRLLGFLTLILVVEFFQTIAEYKFETNESPVINFFLQAFIALLILPVEGVLRKHLTKKPKEIEE